jgi:energy-coupling factor transport system ATP-binding protein
MNNIKEEEIKPNRSMISVEGYSYSYPFTDVMTLQNLHFNLEKGEVLAVIGDSGSGKTTLFSSIIGLNHDFYRGGIHKGIITIQGELVGETDIFHIATKFGLVTQDFRNQLLVDRVSDAIAYPLENKNMSQSKMRERVDYLLNLIGIEALRERNISQLSGGEGQAVVVAAMLAKHPDIMIFDDIVSDLDPRAQARMREIIFTLKNQGFTMLIVDSSQPAWLLGEIADKAISLENGQQGYFGSPHAILADRKRSESLGLSVSGLEFREKSTGKDAVSVNNVVFSYSDFPAVDHVSCGITEGSITGIIGHNGSGKTTLLKIMSGIIKPQEGGIFVDGINPFEVKASQTVKHIAYLPQNMAGIFFEQTVEKELKLTPNAIGITPKISADTIGLGEFEQANPEYLSAGQRQRLALGCALSSDPNVLLLDEPTKGLNQKERQELTQQLIHLQESGKTIILVSHDWPFVARTTNNVIVMDHGHKMADGYTQDVMMDRELFKKLDMPLPW